MLRGILRRATTLLFGNGVGKIALLVFELALARELGAATYGLFSIALALLLVLAHLCLLGLEFGLVQQLAAYQEEGRRDREAALIYAALLAVGGVGALAGVALWMGAEPLAARVFDKPELAPALRVVAIILPVEALSQCMTAVFRGLRQARQQLIVSDALRNLMLLATVPAIIWWSPRLESLLAVMLVGTLLSCLAGAMRLVRSYPSAPLRGAATGLAEALRFSAPLFVWNVFQRTTGRIPVLLAGMFLASAELGVFALLLRIMVVFTFVQTAVNQSAPVEFARLHYLGERDALRSLFERLSLVLMLVATVIALPLVIDPVRVLDVVLGSGYAAYAVLLVALTVTDAVNVGSGPVGHLLICAGRRHVVVAVAFIGVVIQVGLILALAARYGLPGAVMAEVSTGIFLIVARHLLTARTLGIHAFTIRFAGLLAAGLLAATAGGVLVHLGSGAVVYALALVMSVGVFLALARTVLRAGHSVRDDVAAIRQTMGWLHTGPVGRPSRK
jgi:O-antigen/teichoic acid export membrane protein